MLVQPEGSDLAQAKALLQSLLRIDTSNPPGRERAAVELIRRELTGAGIPSELAGASVDRPNLVARLPAAPENIVAPPLVLSCHLDTVPAVLPEAWKHGPFSGIEDEGCLWGRGAIDMKGFAVMALTAMICLQRRRAPLNRDLLFVAVCDEETGTKEGSRWLVENRPDLLCQPEYVINEVGGFTVHRNGRRFYPVQVAEKGYCWLRITARGSPGHSSMPSAGNCLHLIAAAITRLSEQPLPWSPSPPAIRFLKGFTRHESAVSRLFVRLLTSRLMGARIVRFVPQRAAVEAVLRNTATPTRVRASDTINMLPHVASVDIDGRLVPGETSESLIRQIRSVLGDSKGKQFEIEILRESPPVEFPVNTPFFRAIEKTVGEMDPAGVVIPSIIPGFTDSHNYARLGAVCYGFYPLQLDPGLPFAALFHGIDERIPVEGFFWGIATLLRLLSRFMISTSDRGSRP